MKKCLAILVMVFCISIFSSGCMYIDGKVTVNADGSGFTDFNVGIAKSVLDQTGKTPKDFFGSGSLYHAETINGREYLVLNDYGDAWNNLGGMDASLEDLINGNIDQQLGSIYNTLVGTIAQEVGPVTVVPIDGGFRLNVELHDGFGPDMVAEHIWPDNVTNESLAGMTLKDLVAQDIDGLVLKVTFEMPYTVVKTSGGNSGVTVNGKTITLDYLEMIKSGDKSWTFESTKDTKAEKFPDVTSDAIIATPTASTVQVNGKSVSFDAYTIGGSNYFKLRDLAYALSGTAARFDVAWDGTNNAISLTSGRDYTIIGGEMTGKGAGNKTPSPTSAKVYLDGKEVQFAAYTIDGNNYFKLRDIGKAIDFWVDWDGENNRVIIDTTIVNSGLVYDDAGNIIDGIKWDTNTPGIS